ncbi:MAG: 3,4-dihydroxy-2-butanone 4-phosphate synthase [Verrucomicrobiaceae bacterium]|nr:3,4-dihydroxy-2-butanone 4-phosphate synthase [Verrucomicrobiaceae bacterium]
MALNTIEEIIQDIRLGKMVILMDDEDRENEGDVVMAAECVSAEHIAFMARYACGLICMPMTRERCAKLNLPLMVQRNASGFGTKFTVSIEAAHGVSTGISAADRALTVRAAVARNAKAEDIVQPGHIFPLMADPGGVMVRAGHTEAACDLARLAGFEASGVICEVMNPDGTMARRPDLEKFAQEHNLKIGTIADLIHYRVVNESSIEKINEGPIHTDYGDFILHTYRDHLHDDIHFAIVNGDLKNNPAPLVRVQFSSVLRDLVGTQPRGHSSWNTHRCLERIAKEGGVVLLLAGSESTDDLLASADIALGKRDTPAPAAIGGRSTLLTIGLGSQILRDLGLHKFRVMGTPVKYNAISGFDLEVIDYVDPD